MGAMKYKCFADMNCSLAKTLDIVGERWTLLILRDAFFGVKRFVHFERNLGIAKNILCDRLAKLVDNEVLRKVDVGEHGSRFEYRLTEKGRDLFPVVVALRQWGDKWNPAPDGQPLDLRDRESGQPIQAVTVQNAKGEPLSIRDVLVAEDLEKASNQG